jgi:hypothetical protein
MLTVMAMAAKMLTKTMTTLMSTVMKRRLRLAWLCGI